MGGKSFSRIEPQFNFIILTFKDSPMVDEMFDGPGGQMDVVDSEDSVMTGPVSSLLSELTANERTVHADFYNNFGDLFDDKDLN